jgi:hypothetical protein
MEPSIRMVPDDHDGAFAMPRDHSYSLSRRERVGVRGPLADYAVIPRSAAVLRSDATKERIPRPDSRDGGKDFVLLESAKFP